MQNDTRVGQLTIELNATLDAYGTATTAEDKALYSKELEQLKIALSAAKMIDESSRANRESVEKSQEKVRKAAHTIKEDWPALIMKSSSEALKYFSDFDRYWEINHREDEFDPKAIQLLKVIMSGNALAAIFFSEVLEPKIELRHQNNQKLELPEFKGLFLTYFKSTTWKTEESLKFWALQYKKSETIQEFLDRYFNRARMADIDLKQDNEVLAKAFFDILPPSTTRNVPTTETRVIKIAEKIREFRGLPEDTVHPTVYCPCCSEPGKFICANAACNFFTTLAAPLKKIAAETKRKLPVEDEGGRKEGKKPMLGDRDALKRKKQEADEKFKRAKENGLCVDCDAEYKPGHYCEAKKKRQEAIKKLRFEAISANELDNHDLLFSEIEEFQEMMFQSVETPLSVLKGPSTVIQVDGKTVVAIIDTMASSSFINEDLVRKLEVETVTLDCPLMVIMANRTEEPIVKTTVPVEIRTHDERSLYHSFKVFPTEHGMVLGQDILPQLGIYLGNLNSKEIPRKRDNEGLGSDDPEKGNEMSEETLTSLKVDAQEMSDRDLMEALDIPLNKVDMEIYKFLLEEVAARCLNHYFKAELEVNKDIKDFCSHPDAVIRIETKDATPMGLRENWEKSIKLLLR